jgi:two-component system chemotaxis sensor kinase CheA
VSEDEEIVQAFLEESRENLDQLDHDLVDLEARPSDPELLARVFRTIHTIKGTCGFLGYRRLEALTHVGEDLLGAIRAGDLVLDAGITTSLLGLIDAVRAVLGRIEAGGDEGDDDHADVMHDLARHRAAPGSPTALAALPPVSAGGAVPAVATMADGAARVVAVSAPVERAAAAVAVTAAPAGGPAASPAVPVVESSVRVDVAVLDKLLDLVGELVLAKGRIGEVADDEVDGALALPYRQLQLLTSELQDGVMRARLQPVGTVIGKFRRIARDLAAALDKHVLVEVEGESVGVDKAVNEALRDPLLHLVRNAVDHGIETPGQRLAAGKPPEGRLDIRAHQEAGRVRVEVSDDGRGIDVDELVRRTVAAGGLRPAEAAALSPSEALDLMFLPGLSTKDEVTAMSGRGVGMDVVRTNLQRVGGSIDAWSEPGRGATFRINVPLTLAILPALLVWCGDRRYALPQVDVHEIVHLDAGQAGQAVHDVAGTPVHRLRGRLLPLVTLAGRLNVEPAAGDGSLTVVVVARDSRRFGLIVDAVGDTTEAVAKPLPEVIRSIAVFSGVTILGDGRPSLILDVAGLASAAGIDHGRDEDDARHHTDGEEADNMVLAHGAEGGRLAVRLTAVRRLEQFPTDDIVRLGTREIVDYRGAILPLVRVSDLLDPGRPTGRAPAATVPTIVCDSSVGPVGLIVDGIDDIVPEPPTPPQPPTRRGVSACLVVDDGIAELIDIEVLVGAAGLAMTP